MTRPPWGALALVLSTLGCSSPVASNLGEADASRVVVVLEEHGIGAQKAPDPTQEGRWRVGVGRSEVSQALAVLQEAGLPPTPAPGVLETLGDSSLIPSRSSEQARWLTGISGELEQSLRQVPGVHSARVHLALPPTAGFTPRDQTQPPTASVLLLFRSEQSPLPVESVKQLVSGAVPGLASAEVSVVLRRVSETTITPIPLAHFGPLTVSRGSLGMLRLLLAVAILLNTALVAAVLWFWSRARRLRAQPSSPAAEPVAHADMP